MAGLSSSNSYLSYLIAAGVTVGTFALLGYMVSRDENKGVAPKPKKSSKKTTTNLKKNTTNLINFYKRSRSKRTRI